MKVTAILICRKFGESAIILESARDLQDFGFFMRRGISENINFAAKTIVRSVPIMSRTTVSVNEDISAVCHVFSKRNGLTGVMFTDREYPEHIAYKILGDILRKFEEYHRGWDEVKEDYLSNSEMLMSSLERAKNPAKIDKLVKVQEDVDEIIKVMHMNIQQVLKRGEHLDDLIETSRDLSDQAKVFAKSAKNMNRCCKLF